VRFLRLLFGLLAIALVATACAGWFLVVADPLPEHADAIVILAGSIPDRVLEAVDLYHDGVAPQLVVSRERQRATTFPLRARGVRLPEGDELTRSVLTQLGVPESAVLTLRRRGSSTMTEARTIARWACSHRFRTLVAVTSPAHTRRARLILRQSLGPSVRLSVRPSRYDPFPPWRWWRVRHHAKTVLREYEKLAHYWLQERWQIRSCGGLVPRR
jgi:uncharacterized SAM-binding protein YcdF (DUF218 family)